MLYVLVFELYCSGAELIFPTQDVNKSCIKYPLLVLSILPLYLQVYMTYTYVCAGLAVCMRSVWQPIVMANKTHYL